MSPFRNPKPGVSGLGTPVRRVPLPNRSSEETRLALTLYARTAPDRRVHYLLQASVMSLVKAAQLE